MASPAGLLGQNAGSVFLSFSVWIKTLSVQQLQSMQHLPLPGLLFSGDLASPRFLFWAPMPMPAPTPPQKLTPLCFSSPGLRGHRPAPSPPGAPRRPHGQTAPLPPPCTRRVPEPPGPGVRKPLHPPSPKPPSSCLSPLGLYRGRCLQAAPPGTKQGQAAWRAGRGTVPAGGTCVSLFSELLCSVGETITVNN